MAENEILDIRGQRWQRSRAALALPNWNPTAVAECIADDLNRGLQVQLRKGMKVGQTLRDILRAPEDNAAAMRAAAQSFHDRGVGQLTQNAVKIAGSREPSVVAKCAADMLMNAVKERALALAGRSASYQEYAERQALGKAIDMEFQACRGGIVANIEASLRGQPAKPLRRGSSLQLSTPRTGAALVNIPLAIRTRESVDGPRHG